MTDKKLTKLYHPTVRGSVAEVPASEVSEWTEQGWRKTEPDLSEGTAPAPASAKKAAPSRADRRRAAAKKATSPKGASVPTTPPAPVAPPVG